VTLSLAHWRATVSSEDKNVLNNTAPFFNSSDTDARDITFTSAPVSAHTISRVLFTTIDKPGNLFFTKEISTT
jgi:translation elongation factor EF-G